MNYDAWDLMKPAKKEPEVCRPRVPKTRRRRPPPVEELCDPVPDGKEVLERLRRATSSLAAGQSSRNYVPKPAPKKLGEPLQVRCAAHEDTFRGAHPRGLECAVDGVQLADGDLVLLCVEPRAANFNGLWVADEKDWKRRECEAPLFVTCGDLYANTKWRKSNPTRDRLASARLEPDSEARRAEIAALEALGETQDEYNICYDIKVDVNFDMDALQRTDAQGARSPGEQETEALLKAPEKKTGLPPAEFAKMDNDMKTRYENARAHLLLKRSANRRTAK